MFVTLFFKNSTKNQSLLNLFAGIGAEYGCVPHTCKFGQVCGTPTNFFGYFTQSTVFMQICSVTMKCALAKSVASSIFHCSHLIVCLLIIYCLFTNMKHPNFDFTKLFFSIKCHCLNKLAIW